MMKSGLSRYLLFSLLVIGIFSSCKFLNRDIDNDYSGFKKVTVSLREDLADIILYIPDRYDTFIQWNDETDCISCGKTLYRFQPKLIPIHKNSGFIDTHLRIDSVEYLTIAHSTSISKSTTPSPDIYSLHSTQKRIYHSGMYRVNLISEDTVIIINQRPYSVFILGYFDSTRSTYHKEIIAETFIKGTLVQFSHQLITTTRDSIYTHFEKNGKKILQSILISED